jgi:hypothetical protein
MIVNFYEGEKEILFAIRLCKKNLGLIMSYLWTVRQMEILVWGVFTLSQGKSLIFFLWEKYFL